MAHVEALREWLGLKVENAVSHKGTKAQREDDSLRAFVPSCEVSAELNQGLDAMLGLPECKSSVSGATQQIVEDTPTSPRFEQQVRFWMSDLERAVKRLGKADSTEHDRYLIDLARQTLTGDETMAA